MYGFPDEYDPEFVFHNKRGHTAQVRQDAYGVDVSLKMSFPGRAPQTALQCMLQHWSPADRHVVAESLLRCYCYFEAVDLAAGVPLAPARLLRHVYSNIDTPACTDPRYDGAFFNFMVVPTLERFVPPSPPNHAEATKMGLYLHGEWHRQQLKLRLQEACDKHPEAWALQCLRVMHAEVEGKFVPMTFDLGSVETAPHGSA